MTEHLPPDFEMLRRDLICIAAPFLGLAQLEATLPSPGIGIDLIYPNAPMAD
jgi:hypothetical protein